MAILQGRAENRKIRGRSLLGIHGNSSQTRSIRDDRLTCRANYSCVSCRSPSASAAPARCPPRSKNAFSWVAVGVNPTQETPSRGVTNSLWGLPVRGPHPPMRGPHPRPSPPTHGAKSAIPVFPPRVSAPASLSLQRLPAAVEHPKHKVRRRFQTDPLRGGVCEPRLSTVLPRVLPKFR